MKREESVPIILRDASRKIMMHSPSPKSSMKNLT